MTFIKIGSGRMDARDTHQKAFTPQVRPEAAETYPFEMLQSDLAVSLTLFWFVVVPIFAGVAVADLPEDKELFTWKSYIGPFLASQVMAVYKQYDWLLHSNAVIAGTYK
jgi:hypothetical protein|eukprot:COSAG06_NODE_4436_length_4270_cov_1.709902_2_plen_109_part_00